MVTAWSSTSTAPSTTRRIRCSTCPQGFPERNADGAEEAITEELVKLISAAGGRTLALFTNRSVMNRVAEAVAPQLETEILVQGTLSRQRIIEEFRESAEASLFAVTSFWQGIDVPGTRSVW
jgi:ATP-dependent DNA helicase DinG